MKLNFTPRALEDIVSIADYLKVHNPNAANRSRAVLQVRGNQRVFASTKKVRPALGGGAGDLNNIK
jgi:plasmid stabilization system protein ParE